MASCGWPAGWSLVLGAVALLLLAATSWVLARRGELPVRSLLLGLAIWLLVLLATAALGSALTWVLRATDGPLAAWPVYSPFIQAAFWLLGLIAAVFLARALGSA